MWFLIIILVVAVIVARFMGQAWATQKINKDAEELEQRLKAKVDSLEDEDKKDNIFVEILENHNPNKFVREATVKYFQHDSKKFNDCYLRLNMIVKYVGGLLDFPESPYVKFAIESVNLELMNSLRAQQLEILEKLRLESKEIKKILE